MITKEKHNIKYRRHRYRSREKELEITPGTKTIEQEVVGVNMGEPTRKEEATFNSLLKTLNDLEKRQKEMLEELKQQNHDKSVHMDFMFGETSRASH